MDCATTSTVDRPKFFAQLWRAARIPFAFAIVLSVYGIIVHSGREDQSLSGLGLTTVGLVVFYFAMAVYASVIITLFRSWAVSRLRGTLLGFLAGAGFAFLVNRLLALRAGDTPLSGLQLIVYMILIGLMPGALVGLVFWKPRDGAGF